MDDSFIKKQKRFFDFINNVITNNKKISHAYLVETNNVTEYKEIIKEFVKKILISKDDTNVRKITKEIDSDNYPDIKYIHPDGFWIKKDQLINLERQYSKKSMLDNKLIYIIDPADKLNESSSNTILKFLEEPPDDIIAILITNNRFNVLDTIVSRCQILSLKNEQKSFDDVDEFVMSFVNDITNSKKLLINFDYYLTNLFSDKQITMLSLNNIEDVICNNLNGLVNEIGSNSSDSTKKVDNIISYIGIIEKEKKNVQYNLNIKLWLCNFILELMEVKIND